jgi:hypothetical protein
MPQPPFILTESGVHGVPWEAIRRITAYKLDLLTTDCVCLALATDEIVLEFHEEMPGWADLVSAVEARFPGIPSTWQMDVAFPALRRI